MNFKESGSNSEPLDLKSTTQPAAPLPRQEEFGDESLGTLINHKATFLISQNFDSESFLPNGAVCRMIVKRIPEISVLGGG